MVRRLVTLPALALTGAVLAAACGGGGGASLDPLPPIRTSTTSTTTTIVDLNQYYYTIQPGENLNAIASKYCVPPQELIAANTAVIPNPNNVPAGATIEIPRNKVLMGCEPSATFPPLTR